MSSMTRMQRLVRLCNHYEFLARSAPVIPVLEGTGEPWLAVREGRLHVLTETSAALTQIPSSRASNQILAALKIVRDQLVVSQQADLARITQYRQSRGPLPLDVWRAQGSFLTRVAALRDVEALLPKRCRTWSRASGTSLLSLAKIRWTKDPGACVYCQLPAFTRLPDEMAGLVLCQEHLAPFVTPASLRAVVWRLEMQLVHRFDLRCTRPLPVTVVEHDVIELCYYYTVRWLLAMQRTEEAIAYQVHPELRQEEEAGLHISVDVASMNVQEGTCLSLSVPPTLRHQLVLLDLLIAIEQAEWIEEVDLHPRLGEGRIIAA